MSVFSPKSLLLLLAGLAAASAAPPLPLAQPQDVGLSAERLARIGPWLRQAQADHKVAGAVTVVARRGKLVHLEAHGFADLEKRQPMARDTIFALASMTKPITAVGILMLMEDGKLLLGDPLEKFLPAFRGRQVAVPRPGDPSAHDLVPAARSITILDLLTHQAGFPGLPAADSPASRLWSAAIKALPPGCTLAQYVDQLAILPLDFHPGEKWRYGDSTLVLGRVIEVVSGQRLDQFFQERIFQPLGMVDTAFGVPADKLGRLASLYLGEPGRPLVKLPPRDTAPVLLNGGGGLHSTAADYLRFAQMLLNGGELDGRRLLGRQTVALLAGPQVADIPLPFLAGQGYGLTVAVLPRGGVSGLLGSPGTYGWSGALNTYFRIDPQEQIVLAIFQQLRPGNNLELTYGFQNLVMSAVID
jgi:CubicO group peptidase (beta-lactamase class C family)